MSLYIGKDLSGEFILHATRGTTPENDMKNSTPISSTTYHSKGRYLEVIAIPAEITNGNWVKFSTTALYYLLKYNNGVWVKRPYVILNNGLVAQRSIFNVWYPSMNGTPAYGVCGYNYNYPWIYLDNLAYNVYILIFDINFDTGSVFPAGTATSCSISSSSGITFSGERQNLHTRSFLSNPINNIDPTFLDLSGAQVQIVNQYDITKDIPPFKPLKIYKEGDEFKLDINNKTILSSSSNMWKVPGDPSVFVVPHDTCSIGNGWDYCTSLHTWRSWIPSSYNILSFPTNVKNILITFSYQVFVKAGTSSWQYNFNMYSSFIITRGGTPVQAMYASTAPVSGPSGSMGLYFDLSTNGVLRWYNSTAGSSLGGFSVDFYRATFRVLPLNFD